MKDLTMGQRIAVRRKLKNLSQEALAAQLEVSRQAISKWESDAAIPEVDKLVALARIFGVTVGWLLGTEQVPDSPSGAGSCLTEEQMQALEEITDRKHSVPKKSWRTGLFAASCMVTVLLLGCMILTRMGMAEKSYREAMETLRQENQQLDSRLNAMDVQLKELAKSERLLKKMHGECLLLGDNMANVSFFFTPKIFQPEAEAYLSVTTSDDRVFQYPCVWNGEQYTADAQLRLDDRYDYSFQLVMNGIFREQSLMDPDFYDISPFADIYTHCHFHLDTGSEQFAMMQASEFHWLDPDLTAYRFQADLYSPRHFPEDGRGYQEILLVLMHNDDVLWQQSILEDFLLHSGGHPVSTKPYPLDLSIALPELQYGDKLRLYIVATLENGQPLNTKLDELFSWERPESCLQANGYKPLA